MKTLKGHFKPNHPEKYKGNPTNIVYRSSWELSCMSKFDRDANVLEWQSEESSIQYVCPTDQKMHRYFPDFVVKVKTRNGKIKVIMIEVKPKIQVLPPKKTEKKTKRTLLKETFTYAKNTAKWNAARAFCKQRGWEFQIWTEAEIFGTK